MDEVKISASILAADTKKLKKAVKKAEEGGADLIHIDFIRRDFIEKIGSSFNRKSIGIVEMIELLGNTSLSFDVHIMAMHPIQYVNSFVTAGANRISFHLEAVQSGNEVRKTIYKIKESNTEAGVAINPDTPIKKIKKFLNLIDYVLIMSVLPGLSGQKYIQGTEDKVGELKRIIIQKELKTQIEVDGGIGLKNAKMLAQNGADILVAGNSIFGEPNIIEATRQLKEIANS